MDNETSSGVRLTIEPDLSNWRRRRESLSLSVAALSEIPKKKKLIPIVLRPSAIKHAAVRVV